MGGMSSSAKGLAWTMTMGFSSGAGREGGRGGTDGGEEPSSEDGDLERQKPDTVVTGGGETGDGDRSGFPHASIAGSAPAFWHSCFAR